MTTARRVTIVDVARQAGVSTTAVSKVLRNADGTSPQMRSGVRAAVDELGYRPSAAARALRGRTWTVGMMLPDVRNPFFADILDGVTEHCDGTDHQLFMTSGSNDATSEARVTEAMIDRSMDGLILIAPVSPPAHLDRIARTVPTVVIGRHSRSALYDTVNDVLTVFQFAEGVHYTYAPEEDAWTSQPLPSEVLDAVGYPSFNAFYDPELNAYFVHAATDSEDNGTMFAYRWR